MTPQTYWLITTNISSTSAFLSHLAIKNQIDYVSNITKTILKPYLNTAMSS